MPSTMYEVSFLTRHVYIHRPRVRDEIIVPVYPD